MNDIFESPMATSDDELLSKFEAIADDIEPEDELSDEAESSDVEDGAPSEEDENEGEETGAPSEELKLPKSWPAELKDEFAKLSPQAQEKLLENENKRNSDLDKQFNEVKTERAKVEKERQEVIQKASQNAQAAEFQANYIYTQVQQKYGNIDFERLAIENPAEYIKYQAAYHSDINAWNKANAEWNKANDVIKGQKDHVMLGELQKIVEDFPELKDKNKFLANSKELNGYLIKHGYSQQEIDSLADARTFKILMKAMKAEKAKDSLTTNRVNKPTRVIKPSASVATDKGNKDGLTKAELSTLRNGSSTRDQAKIFERLLFK